MTLKERITEDMKTAMRSGEKERLVIRQMLQAAIKQREVDERITLDDAQVLAVLEKRSGANRSAQYESWRPRRPRSQGSRRDRRAAGLHAGAAFWKPSSMR
ncbi:MAG: GatB/YqeY domain-containing protein [Steroidobacteraceae bacterium]